MSKPKRKAGKAKARKVAARKPAARKVAPKKAAPAPQQAAPQAQEQAQQAPAAQTYPCNVLVVKGAEKIPVAVTDKAAHDKLVAEFGAEHIQVQS